MKIKSKILPIKDRILCVVNTNDIINVVAIKVTFELDFEFLYTNASTQGNKAINQTSPKSPLINVSTAIQGEDTYKAAPTKDADKVKKSLKNLKKPLKAITKASKNESFKLSAISNPMRLIMLVIQ